MYAQSSLFYLNRLGTKRFDRLSYVCLSMLYNENGVSYFRE